MIERRRHQVGKLGDEQLLGRVAHLRGIVDDERAREPAAAAGGSRRCSRGRTAGPGASGSRRNPRARLRFSAPRVKWLPSTSRTVSGGHRREHLAVAQRHAVGRVIGQAMPARLRFQQQREGRIAADVDPRDRVHLHGDIELAVERSCGGRSGGRGKARWSSPRRAVRKPWRRVTSRHRRRRADAPAGGRARPARHRSACRRRRPADGPPARTRRRR